MIRSRIDTMRQLLYSYYRARQILMYGIKGAFHFWRDARLQVSHRYGTKEVVLIQCKQ